MKKYITSHHYPKCKTGVKWVDSLFTPVLNLQSWNIRSELAFFGVKIDYNWCKSHIHSFHTPFKLIVLRSYGVQH